MTRTLVTGFLGFGRFSENPSAVVASSCPRHELLEVSFAAVDQFLGRLADDSVDTFLLLGVCGHASGMQLEHAARNHVGAAPDVRNQVLGPGPIDPAGPDALSTTLWNDALCQIALSHPAASISHDAGTYLCNYLYYRTLQRMPQRRIGFLHVPPMEIMAIGDQKDFVARVLRGIDAI